MGIGQSHQTEAGNKLTSHVSAEQGRFFDVTILEFPLQLSFQAGHEWNIGRISRKQTQSLLGISDYRERKRA